MGRLRNLGFVTMLPRQGFGRAAVNSSVKALWGLRGMAARGFLIGLLILLALNLPAYAPASAKLTIRLIS